MKENINSQNLLDQRRMSKKLLSNKSQNDQNTSLMKQNKKQFIKPS